MKTKNYFKQLTAPASHLDAEGLLSRIINHTDVVVPVWHTFADEDKPRLALALSVHYSWMTEEDWDTIEELNELRQNDFDYHDNWSTFHFEFWFAAGAFDSPDCMDALVADWAGEFLSLDLIKRA